MSHIICIIPVRGGSKGIPRKNIIDVCGKPLVAWSIDQAVDSDLVDRVIVTTDNDEIARVADLWGAEVFRRSPATATDTATSESALLEVLNENPCDIVVFLQATSPIRQPNDIDACIRLIEPGGYDSAFGCRRIEGYTWTAAGGMIHPNYTIREPRQTWNYDLLEENGSIYTFRAERFMHEGVRLFGRMAGHTMHPLDSYQVDEPTDIELMETLIPSRLPHDCCIRT